MMNSRYTQDYRSARPSRGWFHHDQDTLTGREYIPSNERRNSSLVEDYRNRKSPPISRYVRDRSPRSNREQSRSFNRDFPKGRKYEIENYEYQGRHNNYDSRYSSSHRTGRSKSREQDRWIDRGDARDRRGVRCRDDIQQNEGREKRRIEVERLDDYERSHSRDRSERLVRDFYREEDQSRSLSNEPQNPPCSTVIVQGLTTQANETMIENALKQDGVRARAVSIIRDRNGDSKRYAFVEFDDVFEAEAWLKISKRIILVGGQTAYLNYSRSKKSEQLVFGDWYCNECQVLNFGSRRKFGKMSTCFQCGAQKKEVEQMSHDEKQQSDAKKEKSEPCNVLMVRGMDFATTEDTIRSQISQLTTHAIYDVRLIRDKVTDMSRGFAFVELGTIEHASELLEKIETSDPAVEIEGRKISVGFARHGYNAPLNGKKSKSVSEKADKQAFADNAFAQAGAANAAVTSQYSQSATDNLHPSAGTSVPQTAASNKAYYQQPQQHADMYSYYQQPANQSSYTFDPTTGFYYDSSTGLYYDANSGYYYNGTTGQYLFWNGTRYQAVNQDGTPVPQNQTATPNKSAEAEQKDILVKPDDKSKVNLHGQKPKDARKIAKDMERWAKKMNNANEARKHAVKQAQEELKLLEQKEEELRKKIKEEKSIVNTLDSTVKNKDGIKSLFVPDNDDEVAILKLESALQSSKNAKPLKSVSLVPEIQEDDDDVTDEMKFVDTVKMACLLCKRQFPSNDVLTKHLQMSQLHKQNLEAYRKEHY